MRFVGKVYECETCGERIEIPGNARMPQHPSCSLQRIYETVTQLREKSGPAYDRWQKRMRAVLPRIAAGIEQSAHLPEQEA